MADKEEEDLNDQDIEQALEDVSNEMAFSKIRVQKKIKCFEDIASETAFSYIRIVFKKGSIRGGCLQQNGNFVRIVFKVIEIHCRFENIMLTCLKTAAFLDLSFTICVRGATGSQIFLGCP